MVFNLPDTAELDGRTGYSDRLADFCRDFKEELEPYCIGLAVIPQIEFDNDILTNTDIDSVYLVLLQRDMIPPEVLRKVHSYFEHNRSSQNIEPFIVFDDRVAFSLQAGRPYTCINNSNCTIQNSKPGTQCEMPSAAKYTPVLNTKLQSFRFEIVPLDKESSIKHDEV